MDTVYFYVGQALYYGILTAFWVSYVMLLGYFLWHKQWLFIFISLVFTAGFYRLGPFIMLGGPVLALIVGWQEAEKWKIKNLVRVCSALLVVGFILWGRSWWVAPKPKEQQLSAVEEGRRRAQKAAGAQASKNK